LILILLFHFRYGYVAGAGLEGELSLIGKSLIPVIMRVKSWDLKCKHPGIVQIT